MGTKVSEVMSFAGGGLSRPTRFSAFIAPPVALVQQDQPKILDVLCKTVRVPDVTNEPIEMMFKGHQLKIPGRTNIDLSLEMTFYVDEMQATRQLFHKWIESMDPRFYARTFNGSQMLSVNKDYYGGILLKARDYDETGNEPMNYLIDGVYPISVSGPEFNSAGTAEVIELTVTFGFYRFLSGDISGDFDGSDQPLSAFGIPPADYAALGSFGTIGNLFQNGIRTYESVVNAAGNVNNAINAIGGIFR